MANISSKYKPLFELIYDKHKEVDTVIITGGRFSGKSYGVGLAVAEGLIQKDWKTLYSRFTNVSIKDSISSEFINKLDVTGYNEYCEITDSRITSKVGSGEVVFKGIKTGSGNQTANLKSLSGFNCFVVDEAEEIPDYDTFKKVYYSIRSNEKRNLSILILNPSTREHWIYKKYYHEKNIVDGFNGIVDNVLYIHTSYLDVDREVIPDNIYNDYERLKIINPNEYEHIILGGWIDNLEGTLFKNSELNYFKLKELNKDIIDGKIAYIDVASGGLDYTCMVYGELIGGNVYITDVVMSKADSNYTIPACRDLLLRTEANYCQVETNNAGKIFYNELSKGVIKTGMIPLHNSSNKETRITNSAFFIKNKFYFRNDYEVGSEYHEFMKQVLAFNIDKKLNKHDDAPDALAGLSQFIHKYYAYYFDVN